MSLEKNTVVLHVLGSPLGTFDYDLSLFYGKMCVKANYDKVLGHKFIFAIIHPGGSWSFPATVDEINSERFKMIEAMRMIESMTPDVVVSHMFCQKAPSYISMFEMMGIPTVGPSSTVFSSVIDKFISRGSMESVGLPVPEGVIVDEYTDLEALDLNYPCVVKPTTTENSIGISKVNNKAEMLKGVDVALGHSSQVIIDKFIPGREIRVGAIQNNKGEVVPLPCIEYKIDNNDIRKFEDKLEYNNGLKMYRNTTTEWLEETEEELLIEELQQLAVKSHRALQCRDFSTLDCRVTPDGEIYILEINTFCSLSPKSVVNKMVKRQGMKDEQLFSLMVKNALKRACYN